MCGRFTLRTPAARIAEQFDVEDLPLLEPRYNIAPGQPVLVVRPRGASQESFSRESSPGGREAVLLKWGLVPHWAKDPAIGNRLINARAESAASKPAFNTALRRRRCLIPADGFYEWQATGKGKQPYYIRLRGDELFAIAGLWDRWEGPDGSYLETCTLLTTEPNELVAAIHNRMPVILRPEEYAVWLDPHVSDPARLLPLCRPLPAGQMEALVVSRRVNVPTVDDPECIRPAADS